MFSSWHKGPPTVACGNRQISHKEILIFRLQPKTNPFVLGCNPYVALRYYMLRYSFKRRLKKTRVVFIITISRSFVRNCIDRVSIKDNACVPLPAHKQIRSQAQRTADGSIAMRALRARQSCARCCNSRPVRCIYLYCQAAFVQGPQTSCKGQEDYVCSKNAFDLLSRVRFP